MNRIARVSENARSTILARSTPRVALLALASHGCLASAASAQTAAPQPDTQDIVVTGQAPPGSVVGDIPPENRLGPADIASYGVSTVNELLDAIAEQTQSDQGRTSSGPVVLVNGKRISGVNEVGDLPTESVVRVDILPEEVALKYGYAATQKVVNVILRRRFRARTIDAGGGLATEGGDGNAQGNASYTRIHDNDRLNLAAHAKAVAAIREEARGVVADPAAADQGDPDATNPAYRTLQPSTRSYALNGTFSHQLSDKVNAAFNATGSYVTSDGLAGGAPVASAAGDATGALQALAQDSRTAAAHAGVTLNDDLSTAWKLSFTGSYDHTDMRGTTDRFASALLTRERTSAIGDTGDAELVAMGTPLTLPAGKLRTALRVGATFSRLASTSTAAVAVASGESSRSDLSTQLSIDLPLTKRNGFLGSIGTLTANANGTVHRISGYGALGSFGYGVNWTPRTAISVIASVNEDRVAPTLQQVQAPQLLVPNVRLFDFTTGTTTTVTELTGGNAALKADDRHVFKLGLTLKPWTKLNLTLNANYLNSHTDNPIGTVTAASALVQAALPDRFLRDEDGTLEGIDARPLNFVREDREELRWGLTFTKVLRAAKRPRFPPPSGFPGRPGAFRRPDRSYGAPASGVGDKQPGGPDGQQGDIVVTGQRAKGEDGPPGGPPPEGFGPPPDGMGPPPDGMGHPPGGFGPPPGGFGGPGGPGGPHGPGGFGPPGGAAGNEARLQFSVWHSWYLRDALLLRDGSQPLDLLAGDTLAGTTQPRHQVQFSAGVTDNGVGLRASGSWRAGTVTHDTGAASQGALFFSALTTFDLRLFANLEQRFHRARWARGMRVTLGIGNVLDSRQRVRDAAGATPLAYQPGYLDPIGRTVSVSVRRIL